MARRLDGAHRPPGPGQSLSRADPADWPVAPAWADVVDRFWSSPSGQHLRSFLDERIRAGASIFPPAPLRALALTPPDQVRVVILGQDPYHGEGQAEGLAFSVPIGVRAPPSLKNIQRELARDCGLPVPGHGSLVAWAQRGVLLLNTTLTVEAGRPASHARQGWEVLTDAIIGLLAKGPLPRVYMLWGTHAQSKRTLIESAAAAPRLILTSNHPSPLSARRRPQPFLGCGHFGAASAWLATHGVAWRWAD